MSFGWSFYRHQIIAMLKLRHSWTSQRKDIDQLLPGCQQCRQTPNPPLWTVLQPHLLHRPYAWIHTLRPAAYKSIRGPAGRISWKATSTTERLHKTCDLSWWLASATARGAAWSSHGAQLCKLPVSAPAYVRQTLPRNAAICTGHY